MKISLITTTYNSEATMKDTFDSVLSQSYADIEYIVVDGASSDRSVNIIKEYAPKFDGRMQWISEKDEGIYDAMNKGIRMATGDIVGVINSDDFYHTNNVIAKIANTFSTNSYIQTVFGDVRFVKPDDLNKTVRYYSSRKFTPSLFRFGFMPAHPTFFTYKKYFDELGYYKNGYKIAADYELLVRFLYIKKLNFKYLPLDFMKMRTGGTSTATWRSNITLNKEIVRACKENGIYTNMAILSLKYVVKMWELIFLKNK